MSKKFTAGNCSVEITDPWPVWVTVGHDGRDAFRIRHDEMKDLAFCLERAMNAARSRLGKDAGEID